MNGATSLVKGADLATSVVLAVALVVIAVGVYLPAPLAKGTLVLAIAVSLVIWVIAEALGRILAGGATDPNSGPLIILLALAYWPARAVAKETASSPAGVGNGELVHGDGE